MSDYSFKPFRFWCQKVLPLVYDDSLSYYELLCKLVRYLNDMLAQLETMGADIANLQALYIELKKKLDDYESSIREIVDQALDDMIEDGTLADLVGDATLEYLSNYVDQQIAESTQLPREFVANRIFRIVFEDDETALQSIAYDGTNYYFGGNVVSMISGDNYDVGGHIIKVNATTGALVGEEYYSSPNSIGHCNSMAYADGYLYCCDGNGNLVVVDATTLEVDRTVTQNTYQNLTGVSIGGADNDEIIVCAYTSAQPYRIVILKFDPSDDSLTEVCHADRVAENIVSPVRQGFVCSGNMAFPIFNDGNAIYAINMSTGNIETIINPGLGNEMYPFGEIEDGVNIGGQVFLYTALINGSSASVKYFGQVFKTNIGGLCYSEYFSGHRVNRHREIYVDPTSTSLNPDGTEGNAFDTLEEACCVLSYQMTDAPNEFYELRVNNGAGLSGEAITLGNSCGCRINGGGCSVTTVTVYNGCYSFENMTIATQLYATNSNITVRSVTCEYLNVSYSDVKLYNSTVNSYRVNDSLLFIYSPANGNNWKNATAVFDAYGAPTYVPVDTSFLSGENLTWSWGDFIKGYLTTHTARRNFKIEGVIKFDNALGQQPILIDITALDWANMVNEETINRWVEAVGYYDGDLIALTLKCYIDLDGVTFEVDRCIDATGTDVEAPPFQIDDFTFDF